MIFRKNNWKVSILELDKNGIKIYKISRRIPDMSISETKIFKTKEEAKNKVKEWLE